MKRFVSSVISFFMLCYCLLGNGVIASTVVKAEELQTEVKVILPEEFYIGKSYDVQVVAENASDLYGYSFDFVYDPKLIQVEEVIGGNIFDSQGDLGKELTNIHSNETGSVAYNKVLTTIVPGVSANGNLLTLKFKPVVEGNLSFKATQDAAEQLTLIAKTMKVKLSNSSGQAISYVSTDETRAIVKDTKPSVVTNSNIANGAANVSTNVQFVLTYDETILSGANFNNITLLDKNDKPVAVNAAIENNILKVSPRGELENNLAYKLVVPAGAVQDEVNNATAADYVITFTTLKAKEDINGDGYINIFDVAPVARNFNVKDTDTEWWVPKYDVQEDGIINLFDLSAIVRRFVIQQAITITNIPDTSVTVFQGSNYNLPAEVAVEMSDKSVRKAAVAWNPNTVDTSKVGSYLFEGKVKGYLSKARLTVNVVESASGNTQGNLVNGGYFQQASDWLYYADNTDSSKLYKQRSDGSSRVKLSDADSYVHHINVAGGWIYYAANTGLYKIKVDGSGRTMLDEESHYGIGQVSVVGDWIYYVKYGQLYKISISGGEAQYLNIWSVNEFQIAGDYIYFNKNGDLRRSTLDGSNEETFLQHNIMNMTVEGDWIYYIDQVYNNQIYKTKLDGTVTQVVSSDRAYYLNIAGDTIYYANGYDNGSIYTMKLDGSGKARLGEIRYAEGFINVTGDWVYFCIGDDVSDVFPNYKIKTDGSVIQRHIAITNIETIYQTINQGDYFYVPFSVTALLENGNTQNVAVQWNSQSLDTNIPGVYTFEGTVDGYAGKVILQVTVNAGDPSEIVTFADANLEAAIRQQIGKPSGSIYKSNVANITYLYAGYRNITNLSGIENLVNLQVLYLSSNQISDINVLENLTSLQTLYLQNNQITTVTSLSGLQNLTELYLAGNPITDYSPLVGMYDNLINKDFNLNSNGTREIANIGDVYTSVMQGASYEFPQYVNAAFTDGSTEQVAVTWNSYEVDTNVPGIYNFQGTIEGFEGVVNLELVVIEDVVVTFADPNLEAVILEQIGKSSGNIYKNEVADIGYLSAQGRNITNLSGIENLVNLQSLYAGENQISDISDLRGLVNLETLFLQGNQISDISALKEVVNLKTLWLPYNQITNINDLGGLTNLKQLMLTSNEISDVSALGGLVNLETLWLEENQISDISVLSRLTNLPELYLSSNPINGISVIGHLTSLTSLALDRTGISDISLLESLVNLKNLSLWGNQISDISALRGLVNLERLDIHYNQISNIGVLDSLTNLSDLNLAYNPIDDISILSNLTKLTTLDLSGIQADDISVVGHMTGLTYLGFNGAGISDISFLENLVNVNYLSLWNNQISDISVLGNLVNLGSLHLGYNQIRDISALGNLDNLFQLYLQNNVITDVTPLSALDNLGLLYLSGNSITDYSPLADIYPQLYGSDFTLEP